MEMNPLYLRCAPALVILISTFPNLVYGTESCNFNSPVMNQTCTGKWNVLRYFLHPAQQAVGYAAVKRKLDDDFKSKKKAEATMKTSPLPYVLGPKNVPFLIDAHHTSRALEESGFDHTDVTFQMVCDWSSMSSTVFYDTMIKSNFMEPLGRTTYDFNELPKRIDPATAIPNFIKLTREDPWRSFGALVRKVKNTDLCPKESPYCLRGYYRKCEENGHLTPFFEFRWAYFFNDAYVQGCDNVDKSLWDDQQDCRAFQNAYQKLRPGSPIPDIDLTPWMEAAKLLVPLCRGTKAGNYTLPDHLGPPYGGKNLPGYVAGNSTKIMDQDPDCASPTCPTLPFPTGNVIQELRASYY